MRSYIRPEKSPWWPSNTQKKTSQGHSNLFQKFQKSTKEKKSGSDMKEEVPEFTDSVNSKQ